MTLPHDKTSRDSILQAFVKWELPLKRFLGRFLFRGEDIDDMAQETFLRAYVATRKEELASPKSYLFQVARSVALKELARKTRQMTDFLEEGLAHDSAGGNSLEDEVVAEQRIALFLDAIAELPPQCRRVFLMRKYQGLRHGEIARELGISISAVEKHVALGVERCARYVTRKEQDVPDDRSAAAAGARK